MENQEVNVSARSEIDPTTTTAQPSAVDVSSIIEEDFSVKETEKFFNSCIIDLILESPFFAELSRNIKKTKADFVPTIGVSYDTVSDEIVMYWNPKFISTLTHFEMKNILVHEFYHLIFEHIGKRKKTPHMIWNIGTDLAINSLIMNGIAGQVPSSRYGEAFPKGALIPGNQFGLFNEVGGRMTEEDFKFFSSLPTLRNSEYYFDKVYQYYKDNNKNTGEGQGQGKGDGQSEGSSGGDGQGEGDQKDQNGTGGFDDHNMWEVDPKNGNKINENLVNKKVQSIVDKAVTTAAKDGWGKVSIEARKMIEEVYAKRTKISWKDVLRNFISTVAASGRRTSYKRINKKYPYIHPGHVKNRVPRILVALDESGSITDSCLKMFFNELENLTKLVSIDVIPFDCSIDKEHLTSWKKGAKVKHERKLTGGTDFDAPTQFANSDENRGRWDALIIFTDGYAPKPKDSRVRRAWAMIPGYKLRFPVDDLIINMSYEEEGN
jgi:predicted metal-dependent peptidase